MTIYFQPEKEYVAKRECEKCDFFDSVDAVYYKDVEYWTCLKCKQSYEMRIDWHG